MGETDETATECQCPRTDGRACLVATSAHTFEDPEVVEGLSCVCRCHPETLKPLQLVLAEEAALRIMQQPPTAAEARAQAKRERRAARRGATRYAERAVGWAGEVERAKHRMRRAARLGVQEAKRRPV